MGHPDLVGNMWQNLVKMQMVMSSNYSVRRKLVFDPGDINGIDDDGDNYVDNFVAGMSVSMIMIQCLQ